MSPRCAHCGSRAELIKVARTAAHVRIEWTEEILQRSMLEAVDGRERHTEDEAFIHRTTAPPEDYPLSDPRDIAARHR